MTIQLPDNVIDSAESINFGDADGVLASEFTFQLVNTSFSGTLLAEATVDGTTWVGVQITKLTDASTINGAVAITDYDEIYRVDASGFTGFRLRCSAYTSGSVAVHVNPTIG